MEIPESTFYYKPKDNLAKAKHDADITDAIEAVAIEFPYYGHEKNKCCLKAKGNSSKP